MSKNEDLKSKESSENLLLEKSRSQNRTLSTNISMSTTQKLSLDLNSAKNTSTNKSMSHIMDTTSLFKPDTEREGSLSLFNLITLFIFTIPLITLL